MGFASGAVHGRVRILERESLARICDPSHLDKEERRGNKRASKRVKAPDGGTRYSPPPSLSVPTLETDADAPVYYSVRGAVSNSFAKVSVFGVTSEHAPNSPFVRLRYLTDGEVSGYGSRIIISPRCWSRDVRTAIHLSCICNVG